MRLEYASGNGEMRNYILLSTLIVVSVISCSRQQFKQEDPMRPLQTCKQEFIFENRGHKSFQAFGKISDPACVSKKSDEESETIPPGSVYIMTLSLRCYSCNFEQGAEVLRHENSQADHLPTLTGSNRILCNDSECAVTALPLRTL